MTDVENDFETLEADELVQDVVPGSDSLNAMLVSTDSYVEGDEVAGSSTHAEMRGDAERSPIKKIKQDLTPVSTFPEEGSPTVSSAPSDTDSEEYLRKPDWREVHKNIFVLSSAGKPIYCRYGEEDKLVTLFGVMQALVSVVEHNREGDSLRYIQAGKHQVAFLTKGSLILVAVSKTNEADIHLTLQLNYVYNQLLSILTGAQLERIFERRRNYDLRRLLGGSERLMDGLISFMEKDPSTLLCAARCMQLPRNVREVIGSTIVQCCGKIEGMVFALLISDYQLLALARHKKYQLHPADLHIVMNLVANSESFKAAESWTPICLPKFDPSGFLHAHISYLAEDCQACLVLLTVDRDLFFSLSEAKLKIVERLRSQGILTSVNHALAAAPLTVHSIGPAVSSHLRHFIYKCRALAMFTEPDIHASVYVSEQEHLMSLYWSLHQRLHRISHPQVKLAFFVGQRELALGWMTERFEMYATFEPMSTKRQAINSINALLKWLKTEEEKLFIMNGPTF